MKIVNFVFFLSPIPAICLALRSRIMYIAFHLNVAHCLGHDLINDPFSSLRYSLFDIRYSLFTPPQIPPVFFIAVPLYSLLYTVYRTLAFCIYRLL